ncbi:UNVERIFIED_CONTAM: Stromal cell-derived factor 2-like protein 1 [Siphonaria sp. JEL0065]|nr:Stromal cell-derived factor 2-like protein 1 [Siphonaria sp. JEL0065]
MAGTGSGQQSVTGFANGDDTNSLFVVENAFGAAACARGAVVKCGDVVRLQHLNTKNRLHSHLHASPLSNQQEVSAYGHTNNDDNWQIVCIEKKDKVWKREAKVRLLHATTQKYLSSNARHKFSNPIPGN